MSEEQKIYFAQEEQTKTNTSDSNCSRLFYPCCLQCCFFLYAATFISISLLAWILSCWTTRLIVLLRAVTSIAWRSALSAQKVLCIEHCCRNGRSQALGGGRRGSRWVKQGKSGAGWKVCEVSKFHPAFSRFSFRFMTSWWCNLPRTCGQIKS